MNVGNAILPEYDTEMANSRKMLSCIPDDKLAWQPHPKSMALGRLAAHVSEFPQWALMTLRTENMDLAGDHKPHVVTSRTALLEQFDKDVAEARQLISATSDEDFAKDWSLTMGEKTILQMPRSGVMRGMVMNHMIHHRAQLGVYLRLLELPIPGMYGPSADEMASFGS